MFTLTKRIGYLSTISFSGFPSSAKAGDKVSGIIKVANPSYASMGIQTVAYLFVAGSAEIEVPIPDNYQEIPSMQEYVYPIEFTMPEKDTTLWVRNFWLEPETGDFIPDISASSYKLLKIE